MAMVKYLGSIGQLTKLQNEHIEVETVAQLLKEIKNRYGKQVYKVAKQSHIIVNNESINVLNGFYTKLKSDDIVQFVPVCCGG